MRNIIKQPSCRQLKTTSESSMMSKQNPSGAYLVFVCMYIFRC